MQVPRIWRVNLSRRIKMKREREKGRLVGRLIRDGSLCSKGKERKGKKEEKKKKKKRWKDGEGVIATIALTILIPVCSGRVWWWWGYW